MGREGRWINQPITEAVDISNWKEDNEFGTYPEGARDKSLLYSPVPPPYEFLIPNHRYLYKHAIKRYPAQFWNEVIAYQVGCLLDVPVPPAFVAFDEDNGTCGALIEWFLNYPSQVEERRVLGGDIMTDMIPEFERSKGKLHNFAAIERYFKVLETGDKFMDNWLFNWSDLFLFDALIGNTDRHQDNWALLWRRQREPDEEKSRLAPIFDNGTSLGYEIIERKMDGFFVRDRMQSYIKKGRHHIRWRLHDEHPAQHIELLELLVKKYPAIVGRIKNKLNAFDMDSLKAIIIGCTKYKISIPLTEKRAEFVCHLIESRYLAISERIEKYP
ncbi:MAG: HipA domain-containing protein [Methylobacter tundripaludum]|nr:HipA domain-containing protein [Methylobacter tundripaludum]